MVEFHIVDPLDVIEFCKAQAFEGMGEAKRDAIEKQYALALYATAQGKGIIRIDGAMARCFTEWLAL